MKTHMATQIVAVVDIQNVLTMITMIPQHYIHFCFGEFLSFGSKLTHNIPEKVNSAFESYSK